MNVQSTELEHPVRIVTAASLFDGHDAAINIMRRLIQDGGAEVIHLAHKGSRSLRIKVDTLSSFPIWWIC